MSHLFEKYAKLKERYPDDINRIEAEEKQVAGLLEEQEYYQHPGTQRLVRMCRDEIKEARVKLATDRNLSPDAHRELWHFIEAREWFLKIVAKDFNAELARIDGELDAELERAA